MSTTNDIVGDEYVQYCVGYFFTMQLFGATAYASSIGVKGKQLKYPRAAYFECELCDDSATTRKYFDAATDLKIHYNTEHSAMKPHPAIKPVRCQHSRCTNTYKTTQGLKSHMERQHNVDLAITTETE